MVRQQGHRVNEVLGIGGLALIMATNETFPISQRVLLYFAGICWSAAGLWEMFA